jgi:hypothetical protein
VVTEDPRAERLYERAVNILDGRANGFALPILRHLSRRGHPEAMLLLANFQNKVGNIGDPASASFLQYRAFKRGTFLGAHNIAKGCFNRQHMGSYRHWLWKAARSGDAESASELKRFETRLPHSAARKIRRLRPYRRYD